MKSILIAGYYGAGNLGDEAILTKVISDLRDIVLGLSCTVLSWNPSTTKRTHDVEAIHWQDISGMVDAVRKADLVVVGGGGLFQDYWAVDVEHYLRRNHGGIVSVGSLPLLSKLFGVPCMIYAVGVGPLRSERGREHTRKAFQRCVIATVRDQHSRRVLRQTGFDAVNDARPVVRVLADPAFGLRVGEDSQAQADAVFDEMNIPPEASLLGVSLRYWDQSTPVDEWIPRVAKAVDAFLSAHPAFESLFIPFQVKPGDLYTNDLAVLKDMAQEMDQSDKVHILEEVKDPQLCQAFLGRCSLVLGMRLHALILAMNEGVPVAALPYDPKVKNLMEEMDVGEACLSSYAPSGEELRQKLDWVWQHRESIRGRIQSGLEVMKRQARENAIYARKILSQPRRTPSRDKLQEFLVDRIRLMEKMDLELERLREEIDQLKSRRIQVEKELDSIKSSRTWKTARWLQRFRFALVPPESLMERLISKFLHLFQKGPHS